jgi:hypothetical protein
MAFSMSVAVNLAKWLQISQTGRKLGKIAVLTAKQD